MEKGTNGSKGMNLLQKLYHYRLKIDRKGTPIVNLSSLFSIACLIFAPHMSIAGIILALVLGYHISLETENSTENIEEVLRGAADTVRKTAVSAARTVREEIDKAKAEKQVSPEAADPVRNDAAETPQAQEIRVNADVVEELARETESFTGYNPATANYHSAYSAVAGSVPVLHVEKDEPSVETGRSYQSGNMD